MPTLRFPPEAIAQAKALALQEHLWQRPQVQGITIDGPDSRDLDDAVWIKQTQTGAILSVHIADVAELVEGLKVAKLQQNATQSLKALPYRHPGKILTNNPRTTILGQVQDKT